MLNLNISKPQSTHHQILLPKYKPFILGGKFISVRKHEDIRVGQVRSTIKAVKTLTKKSTTTDVKAVITVQQTVGGVLTHLGLSGGLDFIVDVLGRTLLIELIAAEVDPGKFK